MRIGFIGDVMIGRLIAEKLQSAAPSYVWGNCLSQMRSTAFNLANLETTLTRSEKPVPKLFNFKAAPMQALWLKEANIAVCNLANNHVLDYSERGLKETLSSLDNIGIGHVGAGLTLPDAKRIHFLEKEGVRFAILGYTDNEPSWKAANDKPGTNYIEIGEIDQVKADIVEARSKADIVIVSLHWGPNMAVRPSKIHVRFAHAMIDAGVDIVHGHSSHIFQGVELYKGKLIMYDTGNFIDDYVIDPDLRNDCSFFFEIEVTKLGPKALRLFPTTIANCQVNMATSDDRDETIKRMQKQSGEFKTNLKETPDGLILEF